MVSAKGPRTTDLLIQPNQIMKYCQDSPDHYTPS